METPEIYGKKYHVTSGHGGTERSSQIINHQVLALQTRQIPEGCRSEGSSSTGAEARAAAVQPGRRCLAEGAWPKVRGCGVQLHPAAPAELAGTPDPCVGMSLTGHS